MKHFTQATANGLCTPPCGSSHGNLSSFNLRYSLLMLFLLLFVGSNAAWAWNVRGEGLPGLNTCTDCGNWDSNIVNMVDIGDNTFCATFMNVAAESGNRYRLKICDGWKGTSNLDQSKSNVNFVDAGDSRISFTIPYESNVFVFYNSSTDKIWVIAMPVNASNYSGSNYIRQDLGLDASGWLNKDNGAVKLTSSSAYAKHIAAFVIPKGMQWRYEIYNGSGTKKVDKTTISASNSATRLAFVVWDGSSSSASVTLMPYVQKKSGWKLFVDDAEQGTVDSNGDYTVNNLSAAEHTFYFTNGEGTTFHGVNYFGGCYVNTSVSSSLYSNHQYYKTSAVGTFIVPTIDTKGTGDNANYYMFPKGKFTLTGGAKDVTFNFDGGIITINAVDHVESFTDEVYVYGAGGTNWVTGWSKPVEDYKMTISAGVASKTFYNVTGNGLNFKVWNKTKSSDIDWSDYSSSKSDVTCTNCSSNNICFDLGSNVYDVTVYTDGTEVWVKAKQHKSSLSGSYTVSGDFQGGWSNNGNQMLWTDDAKGYTYTIHNVSSNYTKNGHGWQRFKIFQYNTWTAECTANTATIIGLDGTVIGTVSDDKESDDGRIIVQVDEASDITFTYYQYTNGTKIVTIKRSAAAVTHTVTFDSNGGSSVANQEVEDGEKAIQPANPTKSGYTFNYWKLSGESTEFDFNTTITSDITLVADWSAMPAVHYDGSEYIFWSTHTPTSDWGIIVAGHDRTMWLRFKNTATNAISKTQHAAFLVEGTENDGSPWGILAAKVPAGDWHQVQVLRVNAGDGWNGSSDISNEWSWFDLEDGKNYLPQRDWGGSRWSTYDLTNKASFFLSGTNNLTGASDWTWNGNGTKYVASVTKTLNPATYKFKLTRDRTIYRSRGDYNSLQWVEEGNMDHFDSEHSNVACTTPENKQIQFVLSRKADVTIAWENYDKITVNQVPYYNVTFDSDGGSAMDAQELRSGENATNPGTPTRGSGYTFNFWKLSGESSAYDFSTPVTSDIELVADWTAPTLYTVTFDSNGGSPVDAQEVVENETATEPAAPTRDNYTFGGWKLGDVLYNFSTPVTGNITLVADWSYTPAHISSVSINESSIYTWAGNAITYTLIPTLVPADIASVTVSWSSSDNNVATVENGVITPQGPGTATITCTATDYYDGSQTATCAVKVAPCAKELAGAPSYNVTITGYNSYEDGDATLTGLWNESSDNTEPATLTVCNVRIGNNGGSNEYYAYDNNGTVSIEQRSSDDVDKWYRIEAATNLYYLKNVSTGKYMYVGPTNTESSKGNGWSGNGDWLLRSVYTSAANGETDSYKFYSAKDDWNNDIIISRADASNGSTATATDFVLSRQQLTGTPSVWSDVVANTVSASRGAKQGGNAYKGFQSAFENIENVANPAYIQSQMNSSYYRMKANATVQANLGSALAEADVISVELYADAATSVTLCKTNGDEVATINLNADAATEYTYLVTAGTPLDGENAFIIKAADNHAGIRSITVTPMVASNPAQPDLHWTTTPVTAHLLLDGNFTYTAASNDSQGAISYASEDTDVAQVDASTGEVTPSGAGTTNIIATITADECYTTYSISYEVSFLGLQDYIATDGVNSVTLPGDYVSENIVINKPFTINGGGHSIGNLKVENEGDLTLSSALTVADFTICAKAGNTTTPAASGQVRNASNLTANGNVYFLYTVDPSGHVQYGWYDFTVPFPVNVMTGIKGIQEGVLKENFVNETDYAIMEHLGDKQAAGQYAYKKFRGIMQPCRLYSITLDDDYNYNTIRFQKTNDGALVAGNSVTLNSYPAGEDKHANWNGVGNGTLHHADAEVSTVGYIQVYQSGTKTFLPVDKNEYSLVIGSAFMVQQAGTMTLNQATHDNLLAPKREESHQLSAISIQIASEGKPFSDQLFISADETAGLGYNQGVDVAKAGNIGNVNVPQIWTNAYNSKLCVHEAQLINGEAQYALSLYAPANGSYTLTSTSIPAGTTLYLTQNDHIIWDMSENYTFDLNKGTTTEYGLLLVQSHKIPTGIENGEWTNDEGRKVLHNGILYILHNGKVFNAQGAVMK